MFSDVFTTERVTNSTAHGMCSTSYKQLQGELKMSDRQAAAATAHKPTAAEIQHQAEVNVEAKQMLGAMLAGDTKALQRELSTMPPAEQREVFAAAKKLEADRQKGHESDRDFPKIEFWDSKRPGENPTVDITAQGKHHDKTVTLYDPENPNAGPKNAGEQAAAAAKTGAGKVVGTIHGIFKH